ncbi:MAG: hypothetical protein QW752_02660 [Thermoplasmata archaeon]
MLKAFISGIFPRQDELIGAINRYEKNRIGKDELRSIFEKCENEWLNLQKGLTYISEPLLSWNDFLRPFTLKLKNVVLGPLTRYLETNTFYRRPIFKGKPIKEFEILKSENEYSLPFIYDSNSKILVPGPYTFVKSGENLSGIDDWGLIENMAEIIFDESSKYPFVEFKESLINSIEDLKKLKDLYSTFSGKGYIFTTIETEKNFIDFPIPYAIKTKNFSIPDNIIIELVDVFSTKIIEFNDLPKNITFTTNESLEFLPYSIAIKKITSIKSILEVK